MVAHTWGRRIASSSRHSEFQASFDYRVRLSLKNQTKPKTNFLICIVFSIKIDFKFIKFILTCPLILLDILLVGVVIRAIVLISGRPWVQFLMQVPESTHTPPEKTNGYKIFLSKNSKARTQWYSKVKLLIKVVLQIHR